MRLMTQRSATRFALSLTLVAVSASAAQAQWSYSIYADPVNSGDGTPYGALLCTGTTGTGTGNNFSYSGSDWASLCPALTSPARQATLQDGGLDHFGAIFRGIINVTATDQYSFGVGSDDGSDLFVDGVSIASAPGNHSPAGQSKLKSLTPGSYEVDVDYYEWEGGQELDVTLDPRLTATPAPALTSTPEPASLALLGTGMLGLGGVSLRRRRKQVVG